MPDHPATVPGYLPDHADDGGSDPSLLAPITRLAASVLGASAAFVAMGPVKSSKVVCFFGEAPGSAELAFSDKVVGANTVVGLRTTDTSFYAGAPIMNGAGACIGALCLRVQNTGVGWSSAKGAQLRGFADLAAHAIECTIVQRRRVERAQNTVRRLEACLEVLPQGIAIFGDTDRMTFCNQSFLDLYPKCSHHFKKGILFEDIVRIGLATNHFINLQESNDRWLVQRMANHALPSHTFEHTTGDGRSIRVDERRTAAGDTIGVRTDITEIKNREASFRLLFDANPVPMYVLEQETFRFLDVNEAALAQYGYSRNDFLSMTAFDIRPESEHDALKTLFGSKMPDKNYEREWTHLRADGSEILARVYWQMTDYDGRSAELVAVIDITEHRRALDELRRTRSLLDNIVESMPVGISVKDLLDDGRYVLANRAWGDLYGRKADTMLRRTDHDLFDRATAEASTAQDSRVLSSRALLVIDEEEVSRADIGTRLMTTRKIPIFEPNVRFPRYVLTMSEDVTARRQIEKKIAYMAHHDSLTGLPNRTLFRERLEVAVAQSTRAGHRVALLLIDLDHFKPINDTFGHPAGDALLRAVSGDLRACLRTSDMPARLGGDEFAIIQSPIRGPNEAKALAAKISKVLTRIHSIDGNDLKVGVSIGIATAPQDGVEADILFKHADLALYRSKRDGRGVSRFYDASLDHFVRLRRAGDLDIQGGLTRGEFELHYQPILDLPTGRVLGYEALPRWRHPLRGMLLPGEFLGVEAEDGLVSTLGEWVLRQACQHATRWPKPLKLTINVARAQIEALTFPATVLASLASSGLPANRLRIDIRESNESQGETKWLRTLATLHGMGIELALEAVGDASISLTLISSLPFATLKLAPVLVQGTSRVRQPEAMIRAITSFAAELGMTTTAVGVETREQLDAMRTAGCTAAQGFFIGRPVPFDAENGIALAS